MKAYMVRFKDGDWIDFVHAKNCRDARNKFWRSWGGEGAFVDARAKREPHLDDKPLVGVNIVDAGYGEDWLDVTLYTCKCELCRPTL